MLDTDRIVETLGGTQVLKRTIGSWNDFHELILGGLPVSTYTHLLTAFSLTAQEAAAVFHISTERWHDERIRDDLGWMNLIASFASPVSRLVPARCRVLRRKHDCGCTGQFVRLGMCRPSPCWLPMLVSSRLRQSSDASNTASIADESLAPRQVCLCRSNWRRG